MGCNNISSIAKAAHASKAKEEIYSTVPIRRLVFHYPQESKASSHVTVTWKNKYDHSGHPSLPSSSPSSICWVWCQVLCNVLLVSWGQFSWLCPLWIPCASPASSLVVWAPEKTLMLCKCSSAATKTSLRYQHWFHHKFKI